jgi:hypothetical protein
VYSWTVGDGLNVTHLVTRDALPPLGCTTGSRTGVSTRVRAVTCTVLVWSSWVSPASPSCLRFRVLASFLRPISRYTIGNEGQLQMRVSCHAANTNGAQHAHSPAVSCRWRAAGTQSRTHPAKNERMSGCAMS